MVGSFRFLCYPVLVQSPLFLNCDAKVKPFPLSCNSFSVPPEKTMPFFYEGCKMKN